MMDVSMVARATVVLAVCFGALQLGRAVSASLRSLLLTVTFGVLLMLPVATTVFPSIRVAIPLPQSSAVGASTVQEPSNTVSQRWFDAPDGTGRPAARPWSVAWLLRMVWGLGAILFAIPVVLEARRARRLRRGASAWPRGQAIVDTMVERGGGGYTINVVMHGALAGPLATGFQQAAVMFPPDAREWTDDDIRRALLHEMEHIRRCDWPVLLAARIACATYWFHPLVWIAWRRLRLEAERACDDAVVRVCDAAGYAEQLVGLASRLAPGTRLPLLSMATQSELAARVSSMLDPRQPRNRPAALSQQITVAAALALLVIVTVPQLVRVSARTRQAAAESPNIGEDVKVGGASLSGYLYDPFGRPLEGVELSVESLSFGAPPQPPDRGPFVRATTTDAAGHFAFEYLRPDLYGLVAPITDFVPLTHLTLKAGEHVEHDLHMKIESMTGGFTVCRDCSVRSGTYVVPDSIVKEFERDEQDARTAPVTGPEPLGGYLADRSILEYPESLRHTDLEGSVVVEGRIGTDGLRTGMRIVSASDPRLGAAALDMLREERWKPASVRGVPVEVPFRIQIEFILRPRDR